MIFVFSDGEKVLYVVSANENYARRDLKRFVTINPGYKTWPYWSLMKKIKRVDSFLYEE